MPTVFLAGDSTCAGKDAAAAPEAGWGMALPFFLDGSLAVDNRAVNGRSSRSFVEEGRLREILAVIRPGDRLLVQFGHNDAKDDDRHTDPWAGYQRYLRHHLDGARQRGARPVLLTPVERRRFDGAGNAVPTHGKYPDAVRALARQESVPLVDIQALTAAYWQRLGAAATKGYFNWAAGNRDDTHLQPAGAIVVARLVARGLAAVGELSPGQVRRLDQDVPAGWVTWPDPA